LETAVLLELERRGCEVGYLRTDEGYEVDFHACDPNGSVWLIQVSAEVRSAETWEREVRALASAAKACPDATAVLLTADNEPPDEALPSPLAWQSAAAWLLGEPLST
jgi:hypothetical protein